MAQSTVTAQVNYQRLKVVVTDRQVLQVTLLSDVGTAQGLVADAKAAAAAASDSATTAATHALAAHDSEDKSAANADTANNAAAAASNSEARAKRWAEAEEDAEVEPGRFSALHHAAKASEAADDSESAAVAAAASEEAANNSEARAQQWAEADIDVAVAPGQYSARHHATHAAALAEQAENAATAADGSKRSAGEHAQTAGEAAAVASNQAQSAGNAAAAAEAHQIIAHEAANQANTSREQAERWADAEEDSDVEPGRFSALHHANKAATSAGTAMASAQTAESYRDDAAHSQTAAANNEALAQRWATATEEIADGHKGALGYAQDAQGYYQQFANRYFGDLSVDPATKPNGQPLQAGDWYFNTTSKTPRIYSGQAWQEMATPPNALRVDNLFSEIHSLGALAQNQALANLGILVNGYELKLSSYLNQSFNIGAQDTNLTDIAFNPAGTRVFFLGDTADSAYQCSLSQPFDLTTANYDGIKFPVGAQQGAPSAITFRPDGFRMYVSGLNTGRVFQYTLDRPFDLSSAHYDGVAFNLRSQLDGKDFHGRGLAFDPTGTRLFCAGSFDAEIFQCSLTSAYDLNTASYDGIALPTLADNLHALALSHDGTRLFVTGLTNREVLQYNLGTGFDLNTAVYSGVSFSTSAQETSPVGLAFNTSGTRMFIAGNSSNAMYAYTVGSIQPL